MQAMIIPPSLLRKLGQDDDITSDDVQDTPVVQPKPKQWVDITAPQTTQSQSRSWVDINEPTTNTQTTTTQPPNQPKGFWQGVIDLPEEMYTGLQKGVKSAEENIGKGNYPGAFHDIFAPIADPISGWLSASARGSQGLPPIPMERGEAGAQAAGFAGFPTQAIKEAWDANDYPRLGGQATSAALMLLAPHAYGKYTSPKAIPRVPLPPAFEPKFSEFGKWAEPTEQPRIPGTEHIDFTQGHPELQPQLEQAPIETGGYQQDLPYGARSWGNVPEPRFDTEGQYGLPFAPDVNYQGVSRETPFQFGRTPTMEDFAPQSAAPPAAESIPTEPTATSVPQSGGSEVPGVILEGDKAIFVAPTKANMAIMKQRGYTPTRTLQDGRPVWKAPEDLSQSAFSRAMRASLAQNEPNRIEGMPPNVQTLRPNDPIVLDKNLATQERLADLAENGYEIDRILPNGDVQLVPSEQQGNHLFSDPFGVGTVSRAIRGLRERFSPADRGGGSTTETTEPVSTGEPRVTEADVMNANDSKTIRDLDTRLSREFQTLIGTDLRAANESNQLRLALHRRYRELNAAESGAQTEPPTPQPVAQPRQTMGERLRQAMEPPNRPQPVQSEQIPFEPSEPPVQSNDRPTSANRPSGRYLDPDYEQQIIQNLANVDEAHKLADEYGRLHQTASRLSDPSEAQLIEQLYNDTLTKRNELLKAEAPVGHRPVSEVMDQYAQERMSPKERQRYERKKNKPLSGVAKQLQNTPGLENIATTVDPGNFSRGLTHNYAKSELTKIPPGNPGFELIPNYESGALGGYSSYRAVYRDTQGKPIVKIDFTTRHKMGEIGSLVFDKDSGLIGKAMLRTLKEIMPYGVRMPSGSFSRHTLNFMNRLGRMVNSSAHSGFINLGELFSENPDGNRSLVDYVRDFFTRKNEKGQNVVDIPKLANELKNPTPLNEGKEKPSLAREAYNFTRGATTTGDLSAPLRQGLPLIFSKNYWKSLNQMFQSLGSEAAFDKTLTDLQNRPLFQRQYDASTGKVTKSFAESAGMKLADLHQSLSSREEAIASNWVETGGFLGSDVPFLNRETGLQRVYQKTAGRYARASNRAYTAFLNQLRADSFESLIGDAFKDHQSGIKGTRNPYTDALFAREIADYVNTATGRGPLKLALPGVSGGRLGEGGTVGMNEYSGERFAPFFTDTVFSPRLMASRVRMLNPGTYMMASPFVRKQYLKSLLSVAGFAGTTAALAKVMGAQVSTDPNSADFMKIRMGNTRLDLAGGFQQYLVAGSRLLSGHTTSSASGKDFELGQGYRPPTRLTIAQNFMTNKLHPVLKFANDLANASTHQPFQVGDRTLQLFVPLIVGDVLELAKEDPKLLPLVAPIAFGAGSQTYDKGEATSRFLPKQYDWNFTGGEIY